MSLTLTAYSPNGTTTDGNGYQVLNFSSQGTTVGKIQGTQAGKDTPTRYLRIGGVNRPVLEGALHLSFGATLPIAGEQRGTGWEYVVTAIGPNDDDALLGRRYLVVGVPAKSKATARRLDVVEV